MPTIPAPVLLLLEPAPRSDYFSVAMLLSVCLHAAALAIHFAPAVTPPPQETRLEVTLVNARTEEAPIKAQLVAQQQINGGGDAAARTASSPLPRTADASADQIVLAALRKRQEELEAEQRRLLTQLESLQTTLPARNRPDVPDESPDPGAEDSNQESLILNAQISALRERIERYNARPRQQFSAPSATAVDYAEYVEAWRKKIELLGTEHYPAEARGKIYGTLQLTVYIKQNGELVRIEIDRPSGHAILDRAAERIVQLAAPFAPLPTSMAKRMDILAITRTWHFVDNQLNTKTP